MSQVENQELRDLLLNMEQSRTLENSTVEGGKGHTVYFPQLIHLPSQHNRTYGGRSYGELNTEPYTDKRLEGLLGSTKRTVGGKRAKKAKIPDREQGDFSGGMKLGEKYAEELQKHLGHIKGGSFWKDFKKGFDMVWKPAGKVIKAISPALPYGQHIKAGLEAVGYGKMKKAKKPRKLSEKQKKRNKLVSQLMKEHNMSLGEASKYIKQNHLLD